MTTLTRYDKIKVQKQKEATMDGEKNEKKRPRTNDYQEKIGFQKAFVQEIRKYSDFTGVPMTTAIKRAWEEYKENHGIGYLD